MSVDTVTRTPTRQEIGAFCRAAADQGFKFVLIEDVVLKQDDAHTFLAWIEDRLADKAITSEEAIRLYSLKDRVESALVKAMEAET